MPEFIFEEIQEILYNIYKSKYNFRTEEFNFLMAIQQQEQTITQYKRFQRKQSELSNFENYLSEAMTNLIMFSVLDNNLRKRLLPIEDLALDQAVAVTAQREIVDRGSSILANMLQSSTFITSDINVLS